LVSGRTGAHVGPAALIADRAIVSGPSSALRDILLEEETINIARSAVHLLGDDYHEVSIPADLAASSAPTPVVVGVIAIDPSGPAVRAP